MTLSRFILSSAFLVNAYIAGAQDRPTMAASEMAATSGGTGAITFASGSVFRCTGYFSLTTQPVALCTVPAGRRWVIETISVRANVGTPVTLRSIGFQTTVGSEIMTDFVAFGTALPQSNGGVVYMAHLSTKLYADGGTKVMSVNDGLFSPGVDGVYVTLTGYLQ